MDLSPDDLIEACALFLMVVLSMLTSSRRHGMLSMTGSLVSWLMPDQPDLRDVYIRGVRGDLWDWLYVWKERNSYGLIVNILLERWRDLPEQERRRILLEHQPPDR